MNGSCKVIKHYGHLHSQDLRMIIVNCLPDRLDSRSVTSSLGKHECACFFWHIETYTTLRLAVTDLRTSRHCAQAGFADENNHDFDLWLQKRPKVHSKLLFVHQQY